MKNLMYKEFKFCINIMAYMMPALSALLLIPNWTYFFSLVYVFVTIPVTFVVCKDQRDNEFSILLPVRKKDIVKAKFYSIVFMEILQIAMSVVFAFISNSLYPDGNKLMMDLNFAFFGLGLIMYSIFNYIFLTMFYKTAYKLALPMTVSLVAALAFAAVAEYAVYAVPALNSYLDGLGKEQLIKQIPVLIGGILIYIATTILAYKVSSERFDKIDL